MSNKNVELVALIKEFSIKFAALSDENMVSATIFINFEGFTADFKWKYSDQLKKRGISMRNIKGEFIK